MNDASGVGVIQSLRNLGLDFITFVLPPRLAEPGPRPEPPPLTQEGDQEALAAVDDFCGMFPISDPELARWIAESDEAGFFGMI